MPDEVFFVLMAYFIIFFLSGCAETVFVDRNVTVEVEKIVPAECSSCPVCSVCKSSEVCNSDCAVCEKCPSKEYVSGLIREAKKCEKNERNDNLTICFDDLNMTVQELKDCSSVLCRYNNTWC